MSRALMLSVGIALALPCGMATPAVAESSHVATTRQEVLEGLNRIRVDRGRRPLRLTADVRAVAMDRSKSMKRRDYFGHVSPNGEDAGDILRAHGVSYHRWGEIIGETRQPGLQRGSKRITDWWKRSRTHRRILLSRRFSHVGVGVAREGRRTFWTVVFVD